MDTSSGLFRDTAPIFYKAAPVIWIVRVHFLEQILDYLFFMVAGGCIYPPTTVFKLISFVNEQSDISAIINHQLRSLPVRMTNGLKSAPPVILKRLSFPCKHRHARRGNCS